MTKTSESQLKAIKKYNEKSKYIQLKFTENQLKEYDKIVKHCQENGLSYQGYIKGLIQKDLEEKEKADPRPDLKSPVIFYDDKNTEK